MSFNEIISESPKSPGVYKMFDRAGKLLYVGKAKNLKKRLRQYADADKLEYPKVIMRRAVARVEWIVAESEAAALILEQKLIKTERPKYNVILKDDKSYPFLALSGGKFPRLCRVRKRRGDSAAAFGPFPFISDLDDTIKIVQKICRIRTCSDSVMEAKKKPCILYQMELCSAPCCMPQKSYGGRVRLAERILSGRMKSVEAGLMKKMKAASRTGDFEAAAKFRGQLQSLQSTVKTAMLDGTEGLRK